MKTPRRTFLQSLLALLVGKKALGGEVKPNVDHEALLQNHEIIIQLASGASSEAKAFRVVAGEYFPVSMAAANRVMEEYSLKCRKIFKETGCNWITSKGEPRFGPMDWGMLT